MSSTENRCILILLFTLGVRKFVYYSINKRKLKQILEIGSSKRILHTFKLHLKIRLCLNKRHPVCS